MVSQHEIAELIGGTAIDREGHKIGSIAMIFLDDTTKEPAWVSVHTGWFGTHESLVPLDGAIFDGDLLKVAFAKEHVKLAPMIHVDAHLSIDDERELYRYYGIHDASAQEAAAPEDSSTAVQASGHEQNAPEAPRDAGRAAD